MQHLGLKVLGVEIDHLSCMHLPEIYLIDLLKNDIGPYHSKTERLVHQVVAFCLITAILLVKVHSIRHRGLVDKDGTGFVPKEPLFDTLSHIVPNPHFMYFLLDYDHVSIDNALVHDKVIFKVIVPGAAHIEIKDAVQELV